MKYVPETKEELKSLCDDESIHLGDIDTSKITDMSELFIYSARKDFSGIENWDVSKVTNIRCMFACAIYFDQPIGNWDVSKVTDMSSMFHHATLFNQDISRWDVSNVKNMCEMFVFAKSFNQILPEAWSKEADYKNPEPLKLDELCSSMIALFDKAGVNREDLGKAFNDALQSNKENIMR